GACDRVRITADGQFRNCLFAREESDLLTVLREGGSDDDIAEMMHTSIAGKLPGHGINDPGFLQPDRPMSAIGGCAARSVWGRLLPAARRAAPALLLDFDVSGSVRMSCRAYSPQNLELGDGGGGRRRDSSRGFLSGRLEAWTPMQS